MSALAARRAAAAAMASTKPTLPQQSAPEPKRQASPPTPEPESDSPVAESQSESESESEPESVASVPAPSNKRRKMEKNMVKAGKPSPKPASSSRYYVAPEEPAETPKRSRKQRRFSPSAAIGSDDGFSGGSSEDEDEDTNDMDTEGAVTPWSGAQSPRVMDPGPSRQQNVPTLRPGSSTFAAKEGMNLAHIKEDTLKAAGMEIPGPGVVVALGEDESLLIAGTYILTPLRHSTSLVCTTLRTATECIESYPVFAPTSHPIPVLTPEVDEEMMLESPMLSQLRLPKALVTNESTSIFLIQENRCGIDGLRGDVVPGFQNIWLGDKGVWGLHGVHPVLGSTFTPVYPHVTPSSWAHALDSLRDTDDMVDDDETPPPQDRVPVVLVKGPKRSGKSSVARAALNRLLDTYERVAWLECDLGQGEFGAGGSVGLWVLDRPVFGAPFTHPRVPERAYFLGELNPSSCPDEYMAAIHALIGHYQYELQYPPALLTSGGRKTDSIPLVVNTQGWVKGLGEDLMRAIEGAAEPTHVFAFEMENGWNTSPVQVTSELPGPWDKPALAGATPPLFFTLEVAPSSPLQARYTAADMRSLTTIAYMHARLGTPTRWDFNAPLFAVRPYLVKLGGDGALQRAFLSGEGSDAISPADLPLALNGSLVALLEDSTAAEEDMYVSARVPPAVDDATFLGLALVRAVRPDPTDSHIELQLLTPLGSAELARANALVCNRALELPACGLLDWRERVPGGGVSEDGLAGYRWDDVPFFDASGTDAVGGDRRRFRRNIQRKGV